MDIYEAVLTRKSVRAFTNQDIPEDVLRRVLEAGRHAPSANNFQEWRFVVVRDAQSRAKLSRAACRQSFVATAPVVLACCAEGTDHLMTCGQLSYPIDVAIAVDHITLCAAAEGLGTCWIGAFYEDEVKKLLGIPRQVRVVVLLPMGYPQNPTAVRKSRISLEKIVKYERWDAGG
jgi:nitroreductase